jgi:hypothetical protein
MAFLDGRSQTTASYKATLFHLALNSEIVVSLKERERERDKKETRKKERNKKGTRKEKMQECFSI